MACSSCWKAGGSPDRRLPPLAANLVDLVGQPAHRVLEPDQIFGRRETAQRVAHLGEARVRDRPARRHRAPACRLRPTRSDSARTSVSSVSTAWRGIASVERAADLGKVAAQRGERVFVGLMQRGNLGGDLAKLVLEHG